MPISRRDLLRHGAAAGATIVLGPQACSDASGTDPDGGVDVGSDAAADASVDAAADHGFDGRPDTVPDPDWRDELDEYGWDGEPGPADLFAHGVASGDPLADAIILWTRVSPTSREPVSVWWEISENEAFTQRVGVGEVTTDESRDFTVKVDAGGLTPGRTYWYRFFVQGRVSTVGRTRTAPVGDVEAVRLALCSCSKIEDGWFYAYRDLAEQSDIDAVLHVGDYIYEYADDPDNFRPTQPDTELIRLQDYRGRYAHYRLDPDLQLAHAAHPWIVVWDDHESTNNAWVGGAQNHQPDEGDWQERKRAAYRAYVEWLPVREQEELKIWRGFRFGDRVDLAMLDTRIWGRDAQVEQGGDADDPDRQILGADQEAWLLDRIATSDAQWKVIGQQVPMSVNDANGFDFVGDKWGEYPAARRRLWDTIRGDAIEDVVVMSGDIHTFWAIDMCEEPYDADAYDPETGAGAFAVELVAGGITSGGPGGLFGQGLGDVQVRENPHVHYANIGDHGFVLAEFGRERMTAEFRFVENYRARNPRFFVHATLDVDSGSNHLVRRES